MNITKALADENRVRMLLALREGELCVCQITELFGLAVSTTSKHLSILYQAGLVNARKSGRWMHYSLPGKTAEASIRDLLRWLQTATANDPQVASDAERLRKILTIDPAELARKQCCK
jgi:ArsR family transcriptional regulator